MSSLTKQEFWEKMRSPYAIRLNENELSIKGEEFHTDEPPESDPEFMATTINCTIKGLGI